MVDEATFQKAVTYITTGPAIDGITTQMQLSFYALFKQATEGPCKSKKPSRLKLVQRKKWFGFAFVFNV